MFFFLRVFKNERIKTLEVYINLKIFTLLRFNHQNVIVFCPNLLILEFFKSFVHERTVPVAFRVFKFYFDYNSAKSSIENRRDAFKTQK